MLFHQPLGGCHPTRGQSSITHYSHRHSFEMKGAHLKQKGKQPGELQYEPSSPVCPSSPMSIDSSLLFSWLLRKIKKEPNPATRVICPLSRQKKRWLMPVKEKKLNFRFLIQNRLQGWSSKFYGSGRKGWAFKITIGSSSSLYQSIEKARDDYI